MSTTSKVGRFWLVLFGIPAARLRVVFDVDLEVPAVAVRCLHKSHFSFLFAISDSHAALGNGEAGNASCPGAHVSFGLFDKP
jgi:hypothetical protein